MKERDIENISDINIRDTIDSNKINNTYINTDDDKTRLTSSSSDFFSENQKIKNTKEELEKVPQIIKNFLEKKNACIVNFKNIEPV